MSFLYDRLGKRKYVTVVERNAFLRESESCSPETRTFCAVLAYTGARISEVLALTPNHFDFRENYVVIESLKKRSKGIFRSIPLPPDLLETLDDVHGLRQIQFNLDRFQQRLWPWCRTTAWKKVKEVMIDAEIPANLSSPKALRHGFAISAIKAGVPLNLIQRWLGHSRLTTTAIYAEATGDEEVGLAARLWSLSSVKS